MSNELPIDLPRDGEQLGDPEPVLELSGVSKRYGEHPAVSDLSLSVRRGEFFTLLGPSGCGKTTTLRMLAGLERPDEGVVRIGGEVVAGEGAFLPPEERDVGLVFQDFALFPHLSVADNIAFGLSDLAESERDERVQEMLTLTGLEGYDDRAIEGLSGGERQRVALARSLAPRPAVVLLDEPFSNLDVRLRVEMREEVRRILKVLRVTVVSVTHDQEEALSMSDRVAVMHDGNLEQVGRPSAVFESPDSRFVATFLGQASFVSGRVEGDHVETPLGTLQLDRLEDPPADGDTIDVLVRPDDLEARLADIPATNGQVTDRRYMGPIFIYRVELDNGDVVGCQHNHVEDFEVGERVRVDLEAEHPLAWYPA